MQITFIAHLHGSHELTRKKQNFNLWLMSMRCRHQYCYPGTVIIRCPTFPGQVSAPDSACLRNLQILCCCGSWHRGIVFPLNRDQMNKITINSGDAALCYDLAFVPQRISHPLAALITNSREIHIFVEFDCNIMDCNRS